MSLQIVECLTVHTFSSTKLYHEYTRYATHVGIKN